MYVNKETTVPVKYFKLIFLRTDVPSAPIPICRHVYVYFLETQIPILLMLLRRQALHLRQKVVQQELLRRRRVFRGGQAQQPSLGGRWGRRRSCGGHVSRGKQVETRSGVADRVCIRVDG